MKRETKIKGIDPKTEPWGHRVFASFALHRGRATARIPFDAFLGSEMKKIFHLSRSTLAIKLIVAVLLVVLGVVLRLVPHIWNFAPIVAIALVAGKYLGKKYAIGVPITAMIVGDIFIGFYSLPVMLAVYGSFALAGLIGLYLRKRGSLVVAGGGSLISSFIFFISTNAMVWAFTPMYEKTIGGLMTSYTMALPFFRATLVGDLFYTFALVGAFELALYLYSKRSFALGAKIQTN